MVKNMNKVLVKLYVPIIEEQYDIWLPLNKKIYNVIKLLIKAINEMSNGNYIPNKVPILYDKITAKPYELNKSVKESDIKNGTEIVLI